MSYFERPMLVEIEEQLLRIHHRPVPGHDHDQDPFAETFVLHRQCGGALDSGWRMVSNSIWRGMDVVPATDDDVLDPPGDLR